MSPIDIKPGLHVHLDGAGITATFLVIDQHGEVGSWRVQNTRTGALLDAEPATISLVDEKDTRSLVRLVTPGLRLLSLAEAKHRAGAWAVAKVAGKWHVTHILLGLYLGPRHSSLKEAKALADRFAAEAPYFETKTDVPREQLQAILSDTEG